MAWLSYGDFEIRPNEMRTLDFQITPQMDASGKELLYHRVVISVHAILNPLMMASNQITQENPATLGTIAASYGDEIGLTLVDIMRQMGRPRQVLKYWIGDNLVVISPGILAGPIDLEAVAGNRYLPCDPMGGPFVHYCRLVAVTGDKTAFLHFQVETAITTCDKFLLSNRWNMTHSIDSKGYTTRTTSGRARFNMGFLENDAITNPNATLVPDSWRRFLLIPGDPSLQRISVEVTATDAGDEVAYSVVDQEKTFYAGSNTGIEKIEGSVTVGNSRPLASWKGFLAGAFWRGPPGWLDAKTFVPTAIAYARVYGTKNKDRSELVKTALEILADRLSPVWVANKLTLANLQITQWFGSEDQPTVEARVECVVMVAESFAAIYFSSQTVLARTKTYMNLSSDLTNPNIKRDNPPLELPSGSNTRGSYIGKLVGQILTSTEQMQVTQASVIAGDLPDNTPIFPQASDSCNLPANPPTTDVTEDVPFNF